MNNDLVEWTQPDLKFWTCDTLTEANKNKQSYMTIRHFKVQNIQIDIKKANLSFKIEFS